MQNTRTITLHEHEEMKGGGDETGAEKRDICICCRKAETWESKQESITHREPTGEKL